MARRDACGEGRPRTLVELPSEIPLKTFPLLPGEQVHLERRGLHLERLNSGRKVRTWAWLALIKVEGNSYAGLELQVLAVFNKGGSFRL